MGRANTPAKGCLDGAPFRVRIGATPGPPASIVFRLTPDRFVVEMSKRLQAKSPGDQFVQWYFCFFLLSGFCSILYEIIWLRIAMAQFGVTTAMVSLVLSAFMIGLGLGSWGSGIVVRKYGAQAQFPALRLYALMELLIGVSAIAVPFQLLWGRELLLKTVREMSLSSSAYYLPSGIWLAITLVPWCICMGATFPFAMAAIKQDRNPKAARSFSYLYLANVLGATAGAVVPLFLIELFGFQRTLHISAVLNLLLAASAFCLSLVRKRSPVVETLNETRAMLKRSESGVFSDKALLWLLFGTGLTSMGAEVIWVRLYTPSLSTVVYAFAAILGMYLLAMDLGSWFYRRTNRGDILESGPLWIVLGVSVLVALLSADPRVRVSAILRVVLGIMPFSWMVGFITPAIVDRFSRGDPDRAGRAYAINIVGCVLGPLVSGFLLLPLAGERLALCAFALPWFLTGLKYRPILSFRNLVASPYVLSSCILMLGSMAVAFSTKGFEEQYEPREVRRDSTATVVATGTGLGKSLLVNGIGITSLTPITKMMVHLPNAFLPRPPRSGIVVCFGMGTTHLSMLSWGIHSTAVELVPSVPDLVTFFHPNAAALMRSPLSHVVIDDGRFYLERSSEQYDVITIDPPPPVAAAGSSLLYSKEFYSIARRHLRPGGILQQWFPGGNLAVTASVARALGESFPYVRAFNSVEGWGIHFLASMTPIPNLSASELAEKLPPDAARDLMEWGPSSSPQQQFEIVLSHELSLAALIQEGPNVPALQDDRPVNEYFILRRLHDPAFQREIWRRLLGRVKTF
jgi:spermidine synthase